MAPINLPDGTEVSEIVLPDGSTASEVLAPDGSTVFATDSVVQDFDPTKQSTGSIATITDQKELADLSGSSDDASVVSDGINGTQSYRFDGTGSFNHLTTITTTDPFALVFAIEYKQSVSQNLVFIDGGSNDEFQLEDSGNDKGQRIYRGGTFAEDTNDIYYVTKDTPEVFTLEGYDSNKARLYKYGEGIVMDFTLSTSDLTGVTLGGRPDGTQTVQADFGRTLVMDNQSQSDIDNGMETVANTHNISK